MSANLAVLLILIAMAVEPAFSMPAMPTELYINLLKEDGSNIDTSLRLTIDYIDGDRISRSINSVDNAGNGASGTISWSIKNGKSNLYSAVAAKDGKTISITIRTYETLNITAIESGYIRGNYTLGSAIDITPPTITSPQNITYGHGTPIAITYDSDEAITEPDYYGLDGSADTTFDNGTTTITPGPGSHDITIWTKNAVGNWGSDAGYFTVSAAAPPTITIVSPVNTTYSIASINLSVSADKATAAWWYSLNSGANVTFTPHTTITGAEGSNALTVYANDTLGNAGSKTVYFTVYSNTTTAEPPQASTRVVLLANSIDYALNSDFLEFLTSKSVEIVRSSASNFDQYRAESFIVILGGPDAYDGVGNIVQQALQSDERSYLRTKGNGKMYVKTNTWAQGQVVYIIAGSDRYQTKKATEESRYSIIL